MSDRPARVLIVANRTATGPALQEAVRRRASAGSATFYLLVPSEPHGAHRLIDPEVSGRDDAVARLDAALPLLSEASGQPVDGHVGDADPIAAISDTLQAGEFDELIISTLPRRLSRWLRLDLPSKAHGFGLPVLHVELDEALVAAPEASVG